MKRKSSSNAYFVRRIPADVKAKVSGQSLRLPVGDDFVTTVVGAATQSIRVSLRTADPVEVQRRKADLEGHLGREFTQTRWSEKGIAWAAIER